MRAWPTTPPLAPMRIMRAANRPTRPIASIGGSIVMCMRVAGICSVQLFASQGRTKTVEYQMPPSPPPKLQNQYLTRAAGKDPELRTNHAVLSVPERPLHTASVMTCRRDLRQRRKASLLFVDDSAASRGDSGKSSCLDHIQVDADSAERPQASYMRSARRRCSFRRLISSAGCSAYWR